MSLDYAALGMALLPEAIIVAAALLVLLVDLAAGRRAEGGRRAPIAFGLGAAGCVAAMWAVFEVGVRGDVHGRVLIIDQLSVMTRFGVYALTLLTLGMGAGGRALAHSAEYVAVVLFAAVGLSLMAVSQQLLLAFVGLELASLSLYVLVGYDKTRQDSAEAGLKYFLVGGASAAFLLFGISLIYGLTGSLLLPEVTLAIYEIGFTPLVAIAAVMVVVAFGFKAAAAPFHLWAPDAYQGAPTASAAYVASASKLAGFVLFARVLWQGMTAVEGDLWRFSDDLGWLTILAVLAAASIILGNIVALAQSSVRRLLAYSAIAHAGALMIGVVVIEISGPAPLFYYAATYALATVGAFGVIAALERSGPVEKLEDLAGLARRSPFLTFCLFVFVLSLAGIPPLAGFFGKFYVFAAAFQGGGFAGPVGWLAALAIAFSAVGFYYYLIILKQAFVAGGSEGTAAPVFLSPAARITLCAAAAAVIAFGIWPSVILRAF